MAFPEWLVSVDDHVLEPGHVWQDRVPARFKDAAPKLVPDGAGTSWTFAGEMFPTSGMAAAAGKDGADFSPQPLDYDDLRPACYEPRARVVDMDRDHVLASMCFPSFARFCGQIFSVQPDHDLGLVCVQAYNDWMIDEWAGSVPGRLIPLMILPLWDPAAAVVEIERCAAKGAAAVAFSENPATLGFPSIHDAGYYWDRVFSAAEEAGLPLCIHAGSSSSLPQTSADAPYIISVSLMPTAAIFCLNDWLFSGQFVRHPNLKVCLSEGGIGWIPYALERATYAFERNRGWVEHRDDDVDTTAGWVQDAAAGAKTEILGVPLVELFRQHVYGCFIDDEHGIGSLDAIGIDNVMLETDYPHVDSTWPSSWENARQRLGHLADDDAYKIVQGNARRVFSNFTFADEADMQTAGAGQ